MRGGSEITDTRGVVVIVVGLVITRSPRQNTPASWSCPQTPLLRWYGHERRLSSFPAHCTSRSQTVRFVDAGSKKLFLPDTALAKSLWRQINTSINQSINQSIGICLTCESKTDRLNKNQFMPSLMILIISYTDDVRKSEHATDHRGVECWPSLITDCPPLSLEEDLDETVSIANTARQSDGRCRSICNMIRDARWNISVSNI